MQRPSCKDIQIKSIRRGSKGNNTKERKMEDYNYE